jgi:hypothetical protein
VKEGAEKAREELEKARKEIEERLGDDVSDRCFTVINIFLRVIEGALFALLLSILKVLSLEKVPNPAIFIAFHPRDIFPFYLLS